MPGPDDRHYPPSYRERQLERALRVITTDPFLRTFLTVMDPKALEQAEAALGDTGPEDEPEDEPEALMIYLGDSKVSFRCDCGGNVFTRQGNRFKCNSCPNVYEGASTTNKEA